MQIRIEAASAGELDGVEAAVRLVLDVGHVSRDYPSRRGASGIRRYLDVALRAAGERDHAGLGLPCGPCHGACRIDGLVATAADDVCAFCRGRIRYVDGRRWHHVDGAGVAGLAACVTGTTEATPR